jgi:hypothetical protein
MGLGDANGIKNGGVSFVTHGRNGGSNRLEDLGVAQIPGRVSAKRRQLVGKDIDQQFPGLCDRKVGECVGGIFALAGRRWSLQFAFASQPFGFDSFDAFTNVFFVEQVYRFRFGGCRLRLRSRDSGGRPRIPRLPSWPARRTVKTTIQHTRPAIAPH